MIQHFGYRAYLPGHTSFTIFRIGIILHPQRRFIIRCRALPYNTARRLCIPIQPTAPTLEKTACYRFGGILVTAQQQDFPPHVPHRQIPPERHKIILQILTRQQFAQHGFIRGFIVIVIGSIQTMDYRKFGRMSFQRIPQQIQSGIKTKFRLRNTMVDIQIVIFHLRAEIESADTDGPLCGHIYVLALGKGCQSNPVPRSCIMRSGNRNLGYKKIVRQTFHPISSFHMGTHAKHQ